MSTHNNRKKGYIPESKLYAVIIEDNATDDAIIQSYQRIKELMRKELRKNDSTLCKGINGRTS